MGGKKNWKAVGKNPQEIKKKREQRRRELNKKHSADARARTQARRKEVEERVGQLKHQIEYHNRRTTKIEETVKTALEMLALAGFPGVLNEETVSYEADKKQLIEKSIKKLKKNKNIKEAEQKKKEAGENLIAKTMNYNRKQSGTLGSQKSRAKQTFDYESDKHLMLKLEHELQYKTELASKVKWYFLNTVPYTICQLLHNPHVLSAEVARLGRNTELKEFEDFLVSNPDLFLLNNEEESNAK